jgi:hypothetical protein
MLDDPRDIKAVSLTSSAFQNSAQRQLFRQHLKFTVSKDNLDGGFYQVPLELLEQRRICSLVERLRIDGSHSYNTWTEFEPVQYRMARDACIQSIASFQNLVDLALHSIDFTESVQDTLNQLTTLRKLSLTACSFHPRAGAVGTLPQLQLETFRVVGGYSEGEPVAYCSPSSISHLALDNVDMSHAYLRAFFPSNASENTIAPLHPRLKSASFNVGPTKMTALTRLLRRCPSLESLRLVSSIPVYDQTPDADASPFGQPGLLLQLRKFEGPLLIAKHLTSLPHLNFLGITKTSTLRRFLDSMELDRDLFIEILRSARALQSLRLNVLAYSVAPALEAIVQWGSDHLEELILVVAEADEHRDSDESLYEVDSALKEERTFLVVVCAASWMSGGYEEYNGQNLFDRSPAYADTAIKR